MLLNFSEYVAAAVNILLWPFISMGYHELAAVATFS